MTRWTDDVGVKALYIRVPEALHKRVRVMAAEEERSMQQVVVSAIRAYVKMPKGAAPKPEKK